MAGHLLGIYRFYCIILDKNNLMNQMTLLLQYLQSSCVGGEKHYF